LCPAFAGHCQDADSSNSSRTLPGNRQVHIVMSVRLRGYERGPRPPPFLCRAGWPISLQGGLATSLNKRVSFASHAPECCRQWGRCCDDGLDIRVGIQLGPFTWHADEDQPESAKLQGRKGGLWKTALALHLCSTREAVGRAALEQACPLLSNDYAA